MSELMWNYLIINGTKILPLVQEFLNEKIDLPYCFKHTSCGDLNVVFESKGHADFFKYQWEKYNMGQVSGEWLFQFIPGLNCLSKYNFTSSIVQPNNSFVDVFL